MRPRAGRAPNVARVARATVWIVVAMGAVGAVHAGLGAVADASITRRGRQGVAEPAEPTEAAMLRVFRMQRSAELAVDDTTRDAMLRDARLVASELERGIDVVREREQLARQAAQARFSARTASTLVVSEVGLAQSRAALARRIAGAWPLCATELRLEAAEDLLLRRLSADLTDAAVMLGVATDAEREAAAGTLDEAKRLLADVGGAGASEDTSREQAVATDPVAFRIAMLGGMIAVLEADLGVEDGGRDSLRGARDSLRGARTLLDRATRSELPRSAELEALLALFRARSEGDAERRARALADALRTEDAGRALVARIERWRDDPTPDAGFPTPDAGSDGRLALLAASAELELRAARGESTDALLRVASRVVGDPRAVRNLTERLGPRARERMSDASAPLVLQALVALAPRQPAWTAELALRLRPLAHDAAASAWIAIPLAGALERSGAPREACAVLLDYAEVMEDRADTGEIIASALDIALELARAVSAEDAAGEVLLARALERALRDPTRSREALDALVLERVDLELFPRSTLGNPDRAAEYLLGLSSRPEALDERSLRAAEIAAARLLTARRRDVSALQDLARRIEIELRGYPAGQTRLAARAAALHAEVLLACGRNAESARAAVRALSDAGEESRTAGRAATAWLRAAVACDEPIAAPGPIGVVLRSDETLAMEFDGALRALLARMSDDLDAGETVRARETARRRLAPIVGALGGERDPGPESAPVHAARIAVELLQGKRARAIMLGKVGLADAPEDREVRWWLAAALLDLVPTEGADVQDERGDDAVARAADLTRGFTMLRELSPMSVEERDPLWWRAQLAQLEVLARAEGREGDILARVNRLSALDPTMGGRPLAKRFDALRASCTRRVGSHDAGGPDGSPGGTKPP